MQFQTYLHDFSLCEKHYNQLIASDFLRQLLLDSNIPKNKHVQTNKQTNEVSVQVNQKTHEVGIQVSDIMLHSLKNLVGFLQSQLDSKVSEVEDLKKRLDYVYNYVIE
ncbi:15631_t:CDS:2, partial [Racocetra fulgida]